LEPGGRSLTGAQQVLLAGQTVVLLPQKAIFIPSSSTLVLADVHIGKAASFRSRNFFCTRWY
jgi:metallophosphoesterase superfamily enzyme